MKYNNPLLIALAAAVGLQAVVIGNFLYRQKQAGEKTAMKRNAPATLSPIANSKLQRVTLTAKAAERVGVKTATLAESQMQAPRKLVSQVSTVPAVTSATQLSRSVPYSSLLYDLDGSTWVYTVVAPLAYERKQVKVEFIIGDRVAISDGPAVGTTIVTTGAVEIFGAETRVGH